MGSKTAHLQTLDTFDSFAQRKCISEMANIDAGNLWSQTGLGLSSSASVSPRISLRINSRDSIGSASSSQSTTPKNYTPRSLVNIETCVHENTVHGICVDCGLCLGGASGGSYLDMDVDFTQSHQYSGSVPMTYFEKDLKPLPIPDDVKALVIQMAQSNIQDVHRMGIRRQQLFSYIYLAYLQLGQRLDPQRVAEHLGMNQRDINLALRVVSATSSTNIPLPKQNNTYMAAPIVVISPLNYIEEVCQHNGLQNYVSEVQTLAHRILNASSSLLEQKPKHVAVAIVKYYMDLNAYSIPSNFAKNNGLSPLTLKSKVAEVAAVDNSM
jgi:hypothetical protein